MIATQESFEPSSREQLPASTRIYVEGQLHPDVRVPMREIELSPTKSLNGQLEPNAPVQVYDCSGPWGDPAFEGTVEEGLPALRAKWIHDRADVEEYHGREVTPMDNGYLSGRHAEFASKAERNRLVEFPGLKGQRRRPLRAKSGKVVTQLAYARAGIITPEMEFIAIRETQTKSQISSRLRAEQTAEGSPQGEGGGPGQSPHRRSLQRPPPQRPLPTAQQAPLKVPQSLLNSIRNSATPQSLTEFTP